MPGAAACSGRCVTDSTIDKATLSDTDPADPPAGQPFAAYMPTSNNSGTTSGRSAIEMIPMVDN